MIEFLNRTMAFASARDPAPAPAADSSDSVNICSVRKTEHPLFVEAVKAHTCQTDALSAVLARRREIELIRLGQKMPAALTQADHLEAAMQLPAGGDVVIPTVKGDEALRREDAALLKQEAALKDALMISPVDRVERLLNDEFSATLVAEHQGIRREYVAALRRLGELEQQERALLMRGSELGYSEVRLRGRICWDHLGELDDPNSAISLRLKDLG